jgi:uncharacterized damage-inducible protein DinB
MNRSVIDQLEEFLTFINELETLNDELWFTPISEGKWRVHDIITHIMKWDEYFNQVTFPSVNQIDQPELKEHPDYLGYNEQSIRYGMERTKNEIIDETKKNRLLMVSNLKAIEDEKFSTVCLGERGFTLKTYLEAFFTTHDQYHVNQIQDYIKKNNDSNRI